MRTRLRAYLASPFPRARRFSPYVFPGLFVHVPFLLMVVALGWLLCGWHESGRWLMAVYVIAGVYLGRDVAIAGHYFLPITPIVLSIAIAGATVLLPSIRDGAAAIEESGMLWPGIVVAAVLAAVLAMRVRGVTVD